MGFMGGIFKALGFESDGKTKQNKKKKSNKATFSLKSRNSERIDQIDGVPVYYPENITQVKDFADFVKDGKAIIISNEACSKEDGEKMLDFVQGFVYGANGRFIVLEEEKLYLILPEGMEVEE